MASPPVRRNPALASFTRLIYASGRPLVGALTVLYEGHALHYGTASKHVAEMLAAAHRDAAPTDAERPAMLRSGLPFHAADDTPESLGFDLNAPELGLSVDRTRRFALPEQRDHKPGQWVHPVIKVHSPDFFVRPLAQRNLGLGEAFLEDQFEMLRGSIHHFVAFLQINDIDRSVHLPLYEKALIMHQYLRWRWNHSHNEDIADHYDVGDNIMVPMLGATGCYSCGYMEHETDDLD